MGNQINVHVGAGGSSPGPFRMPVTLESITRWIKLQEFDEYTTKGLIELASNYPNDALPSFRKNINLMISRVRSKRNKELGVKHEQSPKEPPQQEHIDHNVEEV